jgi:hypothetical protein
MSKKANIAVVFLCILVFFACRKDQFEPDKGIRLSFSTDTINFDTIFTSIGSTTHLLKVYNHTNKNIKISGIRLAKGKNSAFRLNINGLQTNYAQNVPIYAKDSIHVFVEVTINPNKDDMLEKDSIEFITVDNLQDVDLIAYGQDVHLITEYEFRTDTTLPNDKPFLITGNIYLDTATTMTLQAGTKMFFYKNAGFRIEGTLLAQGSLDKPVVFAGARLDELYNDVPGQWDGLMFTNSSTGNTLEHFAIRNGVIGIQAGSINPFDSDITKPDIELQSGIIENMTYAGIEAYNTTIAASNLLIADCGFYGAILLSGGNYEFIHTTIGNYYDYTFRNYPSLFFNNTYESWDDKYTGDLGLLFANSIIYGYRENEIEIGKKDDAAIFNYEFDHCLLKIDEEKFNTSNQNKYKAIIINKNPKFHNTDSNAYWLDTLSPAIDAGANIYGSMHPLDIKGLDRTSDEAPDLGAYERK